MNRSDRQQVSSTSPQWHRPRETIGALLSGSYLGSAFELKRKLGVTYKTAWLLKHKLLREDPRRLDARVEIDDAYLGGERAGSIHGGRGAFNESAGVRQGLLCGSSL